MLIKLILIIAINSVRAADLSMPEFLRTAWNASPLLNAEKLKGEEREQFLASAQGRYLPVISLEAIDTTGFPASNSDLHVSGIMGSPYRSGASGGIVIEQMIYDFGRVRSLMEQTKAETLIAEARLYEDKLRFLSGLGQLYLTCARAFSAQRQNERLMTLAKINLAETNRMTKTGQRSIIDNSLVLMEVNDLEMQQSDLSKLIRSTTEQMQSYVAGSHCKPLSQTWNSSFPEEIQVPDPRILIIRAQRDNSSAAAKMAGASQLPVIKAMGSFGAMARTRLVASEDYSAGVALSFPLWNGGQDAHREQAFKSQTQFHNEVLKSAQLEFENRLKNLKDALQRGQETLTMLEKNLEQVRRTMKLASTRYRQLSGPLVDVREAFKQLRSVETTRNQLLLSLTQNAFELKMLKIGSP